MSNEQVPEEYRMQPLTQTAFCGQAWAIRVDGDKITFSLSYGQRSSVVQVNATDELLGMLQWLQSAGVPRPLHKPETVAELVGGGL